MYIMYIFMCFFGCQYKVNGQGNITQSIYVYSRWNSGVRLCPWRVSEEWDNNEQHNSASAAAAADDDDDGDDDDDDDDEGGLLFATQSWECLLSRLCFTRFQPVLTHFCYRCRIDPWKLCGKTSHPIVSYGLLHFPRSLVQLRQKWLRKSPN